MSDLAVGLMSGTSLDGIDAALVRVGGSESVELLGFTTRPFGRTERERLLDATGRVEVRDIALLHVELGRWLAEAAIEVLEVAGVPPERLSLVASHGQTVWHEPGTATLQLGDPAVIAERLRVPVVSDFRTRDVAAGGQGAPLVSLADAFLFGDPDRGRALLNIGGIANVTWVPRRGSLDGIIAFDTGPGVAVVDAATSLVDPGVTFDEHGHRAAQGRVVEHVLARLLEDPYFAASPPKTTGRERFGDELALRIVRAVEATAGAGPEDAVATALALAVRSIALGLERWLPAGGGSEVLVSGGGARNPVLMGRLVAALEGWTVRLFSEEFFDGDAKEAVAFAYLGWCTVNGLEGNVPSATGARGPRVLGRVTPP
ncbi:MAG: anhydro-N-acetylmuramic acid kinase [Gemmatimonadales bacterium]